MTRSTLGKKPWCQGETHHFFLPFAMGKYCLLYEPGSKSKDDAKQSPHQASVGISHEIEINLCVHY